MAKLGDRVVFTAATLHHTETVKDGVTIAGSIYANDQYEFAGIVGRVNGDPSVAKLGALADIAIFVPGKGAIWVYDVREGKEPGDFRVL